MSRLGLIIIETLAIDRTVRAISKVAGNTGGRMAEITSSTITFVASLGVATAIDGYFSRRAAADRKHENSIRR